MKIIILVSIALIGHNLVQGQCKLDKNNYEIVLDENFDDITSVADLTPRWEFRHIGEPVWGWGDSKNKDGTYSYGEYYDPSQVSYYKTGQNGFIRLTAERLPSPVPISTV